MIIETDRVQQTYNADFILNDLEIMLLDSLEKPK